ncbi:hypothetical protein [Serratia plymuthica]|uniref:hypothetical protein n=1 Tax=Serratia plymuthica TaxID=82996 RepID=UPI0007EB076D|nr:hypothetical protein [Serratia plymuthica]ANJ96883.1 hypothetical protein ADP73_02605 [Serratia plymuthica]
MHGKLIFIDDQVDVRNTYNRRLRRMFSGLIEIVTLPPGATIEEMIKELDLIDDKIMYVIDEDLTYTGEASYTGASLIESIRLTDRRIPIYILTSDTTRVDRHLGDVEFVIDKGDWDANQDNLAERFLRHIDTYSEIKNNQEIRFDELLCKFLNTPLTEEEKIEFETLNLNRSKTLLDESVITENDLKKLEEKEIKLLELKTQLEGLKNE